MSNPLNKSKFVKIPKPVQGFGTSRQKRISKSPFSDVNFYNKSKAIQLIRDGHPKVKDFFRANKSKKNKILRKLRSVHTKRYGRFYRKLPDFLEVAYGIRINVEVISNFINRFELRIAHHGFEEACKQFKSLSSWALRYCAGHKNSPLERFSLNAKGFPRILLEFKEIMDSDYRFKPAVITVLDLPKLYGLGDSKPDIAGIVTPGVLPPDDFEESYVGRYFERLTLQGNIDPSESVPLVSAWKRVIRRAFPDSRLSERRDMLKKHCSLHISSKSGPNGPALVSAPRDLIAMWRTVDFKDRPLIDSIVELATITGNKDLLSVIDFSMEIVKTQVNLSSYPADSHTCGKLSIKQETFGKSRLIAIIDFFTQSVLQPLHEVQFEFLKRQIEDGTFDQDAVSLRLQKMSAKKVTPENCLNSLDLTEATNRLPIDLQYEIVSQQFGADIARLWRILCSERPFKYMFEDIYYKVGQPMGTYSSWSNLAIINHMIARTARTLSKIPRDPKSPLFFIIGDDFACVGLSFAKNYTRILNIIGVKISETKGFTPFSSILYDENHKEDPFDKVVNVAELAKRVFVGGVEITPVRPQQIFEFMFEPVKFKQLLTKLINRFEFIDSNLISNLAKITCEPKSCFKHVLSLFNPSFYMEGLLKQLPSSDNCFYHDLLETKDPDGITLSSKVNDMVNYLYSVVSNKTMGEIREFLYQRFSSSAVDKFKISLRRIRRFVTKFSFKEQTDRAFNTALPDEYGQGFMLILDFILLYVYHYSKKLFKEAFDLLSKEILTFDEIKRVALLLTSVREIDLLLKGNRSIVSSRDVVSRVVEELSSFALSGANDFDVRIFIKYEDLSDLFSRRDKIKDSSNVFDKFKATNAVEKAFIDTKEGFTSLLSPSVAKAMEFLAAKFGKSSIIEGPSLLKTNKVKIDNKLQSLVFNQSLSLTDIRNLEYFKMVETTLKETLRSEKSYSLIHQVLLDGFPL